jgi:uncharacterized repeat protein (TIGR01451 family)
MSNARTRCGRGAAVALGAAALALATLVPGAGAAGRDLSADVGVTQQASTTEAGVKSRLGFVVTVANHGPEAAPRVKLTDVVSGELNVVSATPSQGTCFKVKRTYTCALGALASGTTAQLMLVVVPIAAGKVTNSVSVSSALADPDTSNQRSDVEVPVVLVDSTPPVSVAVRIGNQLAPPAFQTAPAFTVRWTATDPETHVASYDVRYRRAPFGGSFRGFVVWQPDVEGVTSDRFVDAPGSTYCFSARATNKAGTTSDWSTEACTAVPMGVRAFAPRAPWVTKPSDGYYQGSFAISSTRGATLARSRLAARHLGVVATRCPGCGSVVVRWNGRALRSFSLAAAKTQKGVLLQLPALPALQRGTLTVEVLTTGKPVKIEGLAASQV